MEDGATETIEGKGVRRTPGHSSGDSPKVHGGFAWEESLGELRAGQALIICVSEPSAMRWAGMFCLVGAEETSEFSARQR